MAGSIVGVLIAVGPGAAMLSLHSHLSVATTALAVVPPVVAGVIVGGLALSARLAVGRSVQTERS